MYPTIAGRLIFRKEIAKSGSNPKVIVIVTEVPTHRVHLGFYLYLFFYLRGIMI